MFYQFSSGFPFNLDIFRWTNRLTCILIISESIYLSESILTEELQ